MKRTLLVFPDTDTLIRFVQAEKIRTAPIHPYQVRLYTQVTERQRMAAFTVYNAEVGKPISTLAV